MKNDKRQSDMFSKPGDVPFDFAKKHARRTDKATSHRAAKRASYRAGTHMDKIVEAMKAHPHPMNYEDIAVRANLRERQVWKRMSDLVRGGWVEPTIGGKDTASGCESTLWALCNE